MEPSSELIAQRLKKLQALKEMGVNPFANNRQPDIRIGEILARYGDTPKAELEEMDQSFAISGRIMGRRDFGKASFIVLQDRDGRLQVYLRKDALPPEDFSILKLLDVGDIVWVRGKLFRTRTEELTIMASNFSLLTKSLLPLPEKWHGLTDIETRYRQRYVDLMVNPHVKEIFLTRNKVIDCLRRFLNEKDFLEVETPMMQSIPGGATARPFVTYHNTLDMKLFLRIAPELYLKRLLVGGLERVYEINRNFRNEGISTQHNPEFTMLEFYQAYATFEHLMDLTEEMLSFVVTQTRGTLEISYQGTTIDFTPPLKRIAFKDALVEVGDVPAEFLEDREGLRQWALSRDVTLHGGESLGELMMQVFEKVVEQKLIQPTFVTDYPLDISPLSRPKEGDPALVDRFEFFIAGREVANAFSELNDPVDQKERFLKQLEEKGEEEGVTELDEDYIRALEYGMPPAAGEGIGIDRLVMFLTDSPSIRDVIFFPQLRREKAK